MKQRYVDAYEYDYDAYHTKDWRDTLINNAPRNAIIAGFLLASLFIGPSSSAEPSDNVKPVVPAFEMK